jgi:hypothetical protein
MLNVMCHGIRQKDKTKACFHIIALFKFSFYKKTHVFHFQLRFNDIIYVKLMSVFESLRESFPHHAHKSILIRQQMAKCNKLSERVLN